MLNIKQNKGIGILELMLSLAIIGILIVMVTTYFKPTSQARDVNEAINMVEAIQSAGQRWLLTNDNYPNSKDPDKILSEFVARNFLPKSFSPPLKNPWRGELTVQGTTDDKTKAPALSITMYKLPEAACKALKEQAASLTCGPDEPYIRGCTGKDIDIITILLPSRCATS